MILFGLPMIAGAGSLAAGAAGVYYATAAVRSQWLGKTDWRGRTDTASVALTFDDGPSEDTERILDVLRAYDLKATFFMLGRQVELFPELARRVVADGHEIGNHSYSHPIYLFRSHGATRLQIERAQKIITDVTGTQPRLARPPCGVRTPAYFAAARRLGLRTVQWDVAGFDWKARTSAEIAESVLRDASPGSIILLHDADSALKRDRSATVAALPIIIEGLQARGLKIVPLTQLLEPRTERRFGRRNGFGKRRPGPKKPIVFLDFDGTITQRDAVDAILEKFADRRWLEIEEEWKQGRIGSRECLAAQMRLVRATKEQIDALLDSIEIDEGFEKLLETCAAQGVETHIISDGFDYCIDRILARPSLNLKARMNGTRIFSSHLEANQDRWLVDFPSFHQSCGHGCATCKPAMMSLLNRHGGPTIFVGDGLSDKYAATAADLVFAKDKLATFCSEREIAHRQYRNLADVAEQLDSLLRSNAVIEREVIEGVGA
jgi:2,3-diketo-5-methylthio-1-phosphopentane phosphatase